MNNLRDRNSEFEAQKGRGRPKGVPNRTTVEFRDTIRDLLDGNKENVSKWLELVAEGDPDRDIRPDPYKALDMIAKLAEYAAPKLSRTEMTGANGGPVQVSGININLKRPDGN
jgi:hypothetical protein